MSELKIVLQEGRTSFKPDETILGSVSWQLDEAPEALEIRLFWYTSGKGERDIQVVDTVEIAPVSISGRHEFTFATPSAPLSFSGRLISLIWAIELVALPSAEAGRQEILVSHTGEEIRIGTPGQESPAGA